MKENLLVLYSLHSIGLKYVGPPQATVALSRHIYQGKIGCFDHLTDISGRQLKEPLGSLRGGGTGGWILTWAGRYIGVCVEQV